MNPHDPNEVFLPARVGLTDTNGNAKFQDLPGIAWRAVAKRLGYTPTTNIIFPNFFDTLPASTNLTLEPMLAPFGITLESPYLNPALMTGLVMRVEGLTNSNTEGIVRMVPSFLVDPPGPPEPFSGAIAPGLIAGRYDVTVTGLVQSAAIKSGAFNTTGRFDVVFSGGQLVELAPDVPTFIPFTVQPELAKVRVRFFTADALSDFPVADAVGALTNRPAYARSAADPVIFKESSVTSQLKPPFRVTMFGTDDSGEALLSLLPGVYGVEAPSLFEYFGSEARLRDATTGEEIVHGWPFASNPDAGPPFPMSPHHALGLRFSSGHEYELDLYARRKHYDVRGEVKPDPADPMAQRIVAVSGSNYIATRFTELVSGGTATLAGHPPSKPLTILSELVTNSAAGAPNAIFSFEDVEPGMRSLTLSHPRNTFTAHSGGPSLSVTLPDWGPPGIVDAGDPADAVAGLFPLETLRLQGAGGTPAFTATMPMALDTVRVHYHRWITNAGGSYVLEPDAINPNYFIPDPTPGSILSRYAGASRFTMGAREWDLYFAFNETNWFRTGITATNTGYEHVRNAYIFGPSNNIITPIIETLTLTVRAENEADPSQIISGVGVTLSGGGTRTTPYTTNDYAGSMTPTSTTPGTWFWTGAYTITTTTAKDFTLALKMRRGMGVSGLVIDATNSAPVTNAFVQLFNRFGSLLRTTNSATNGTFIFPAVSNAQPVFIDITVPGYVQSRVRHAPSVTAPDYSDTNRLVPIPQPKILSNEVDRYGMFLPRVRKAGDAATYNDFSAVGPLTMTWRMVADEHTFALDLPEFDGAGGGGRGSFSIVTDPITETWLVDARGFAGNPYETNGTIIALPPTNNAPAIRAWLRDVRDGTYGRAFTRRVAGRAPEPPPGTNVEVRATVPLWELPSGEFRPVFVTLTARGSAALRLLEYPTNEFHKTLRGEPLPQSMAFAADLIGTVAGIQASSGLDVTDVQVKRFIPEGRFKALPKFTAIIKTNGGFVSYDYTLDVQQKEGQDTPRAGVLALAPRTLGLEFSASMQFGMSGVSNRFSLGTGASLTAKTNLTRVLPAGVTNAIILEGAFNVAAGVSAAQEYEGGGVSLLEVRDYVGASAELTAKINLKPFTSKIPAIGPILLGLDAREALRIFATINGGIGLVASNQWRTEYPPPDFPSGSSSLDQNARRHFLGGRELTTATTVFKPCVRLAVGAEIHALKGYVEGSATIALQGNPCGGLNALLLTPNPAGDWRKILRIQGACNLRADLKLDLYLVEKRIEILNKDLYPIDHQFGTETVFDLIEMSELHATLVPANGPLSAYDPTGPDRVKKVFRPGATVPVAGGLSYTEIDPDTGDMVFRLVGTECGGDTPVRVASAPGILDIAATRLPSGQWLTAWSELAAEDIGNPYATSVIKSSLSGTNCTNWSAPAVIATLPDVATELRFVTSSSMTGLVWLHAPEGPLSPRRGVSGATWSGITWSAAAQLLAPQDIADFDASGSATSATPAALIAWSDGTGALRSLTWNGTSTTGPYTLGTGASDVLDLAVNSAGEFHVVWNSMSGDILLSRFDGVSAWTLLGAPVSQTIASELQLAPLAGGPDSWMLAWIDGSDASSLHYAIASATGAALKTNTQVAFADNGRYSHLHLEPENGITARLVARHTGTNNVTNLREYLATPAGIAPWLLNASPGGSGGLQFDLLASPNQTFRLQGSSNFVDWLDLLNFTPTNSPVILQDNPSLPHRFYRAVSP
ncbi:MAG TPA: carboxypeptidase-like regulatory domain-containing protein [Methylomirabilota bacterium]|nr:carboxypeptidase-like regulatory domain-containing protein [Methylomirabilota bacterium]